MRPLSSDPGRGRRRDTAFFDAVDREKERAWTRDDAPTQRWYARVHDDVLYEKRL